MMITLTAGSTLAEPNLEAWLWAPAPEADSYQIYFDTSVECVFGGILMDPGWSAYQLDDTVRVYLVLSDITGGAIQDWALETGLEGMHTVVAETSYPSPSLAGITVDYATHHHYVLKEWVLYNPQRNLVVFHVRPDPGSAHDVPGYFGDQGQFVQMHNLIGDRWTYARGIMELNGFVTPREGKTWGAVKELFR
jgi:hypothetical protein